MTTGGSVVNRHLVVVPHTHWDREWYLTQEQFRVRLLRLLDRLLNLLEGDPAFRHFMLDGQTIVLDDYLEVRPAARERLEKLIRDGRILIGPWYVLPDEWLVSGEALIRNLRLGLRKAAAFGGGMRVGYVPDQFGHVGQLPQIFRGFGFETAALWRGVGRDVDRTPFTWEAPDGSRVVVAYLPRGYGHGALLPLDPDALAERLGREIAALARFAPTPTLLLMNGSDHLEPQPGLPAALEAAVSKLPGVTFELGTLPGYLARARAEAGDDLQVHRGELRSGLRAPLLPGCASARMPQKQADFRNDRLLTRYLEPLAAWTSVLGGEVDHGLLDFAWQVALQNHPHDSICGCSVDRVHEQMEARFQRVEEIATAELASVTRQLGSRVAVPPRHESGAAGDALVVWNPGAAGRTQVDAELELDVPGTLRAPGQVVATHLRDVAGRRIPAHVEIVALGSVWGGTFPTSLAASLLPDLGREVLGYFVNDVRTHLDGAQLVVQARLGSAPEGELDAAGIKRDLRVALATPGVEQVAIEARRPPRVRLRFVDDLPGHGLRTYRVAQGRARPSGPLESGRSAEAGAWIENAFWRVDALPDGAVTLTHRSAGVVVRNALRIVSEGDRGDEYNFDPVAEPTMPGGSSRARVRLVRGAGAEAALLVDLRLRVPECLAEGRRARSTRTVELPVRLEVRLAPGLDRVDVSVELENTAKDHRLRLHVRAPFVARRFEVESAFEVAERPIAPQPGDFGSTKPQESPIGACPQRTFSTLSDAAHALTVACRGNAEVEAVPEADGATSTAVTLLRAVGWLSQAGLGLRPAPAGPPFATPGAQVPGRHRAEVAFFLHAAGDPQRTARAHAFAHPPLAFAAAGANGEALLADGARLVEVDDPELVISAIEPLAEGGAQVRIWNASGVARSARIRWNGRGARGLERVDLTGRPEGSAQAVEASSAGVRLTLRPWQIVTLAAR